MTLKPRYVPFRPEPKSLCLCGSGMKFRDCCKDGLLGTDIGAAWRDCAEAKKWLQMVKCIRADVTQYTIWHLSHTAPAIRARPELRHARLMTIDIEALADYVELLMWGYARLGWQAKLPVVLERLKGNIDDPRWLAKIAYQRGICALWRGNRALAAKEIEIIGPITAAHEDVDLLQIQLDLHGPSMGLSERLAFYNRIAELSTSRPDKIQYGAALAFELLMASDPKGARSKFAEVTSLAREMEEEKPLSMAGETWFCKALEGLAIIEQDKSLFEEIVTRLRGLLAEHDSLTPAGHAGLLRSIGDAQRYGGQYDEAIRSYQASFSALPDQVVRTFEAECQLRLGHVDAAYKLIRAIPIDDLDGPERADHAFTYFYVALARRDQRSLNDARELLKAAKTPQPFFETQRLQHIVKIGEAIEAIQKDRPLPEAGPMLTGLKALSRYIQLQPNFCGIGLNLNNIIDDMVAQAEERARPQSGK
ncbi:MAG: hypothetical protein EON58_05880 [Alphaproteobacteria bacterium]|nr:MAG: hypothetical protein EON58_05880 [Alphaproteobacteria bacterium]